MKETGEEEIDMEGYLVHIVWKLTLTQDKPTRQDTGVDTGGGRSKTTEGE